ncbi:MAG TPA: hypothetical protein PKC80_05105 [Burkholderiaceae bacterium]|nr:hypothetical protein [Burkholderiaceae bacterium]
MRHLFRILFSISLFWISSTNAQLVSIETATKVLENFEKGPRATRSSNPFEKWVDDTATMTILSCRRAAGLNKSKTPKSLNDGFLATGSFTAIYDNEIQPLCESLAKNGFQPVCLSSHLWDANVKYSEKWLPNTIHTQKDFSKLIIGGVLHCYLESQKVKQQTYVGHFTYEWLNTPRLQVVMARNGPVEALVGNILVKDKHAIGKDGKLYQEIRNVISEEKSADDLISTHRFK